MKWGEELPTAFPSFPCYGLNEGFQECKEFFRAVIAALRSKTAIYCRMHVDTGDSQQENEEQACRLGVHFADKEGCMKQHSSGFVFGIVVSIILGFAVVAGIALGLRSITGLGYEPGVLQATKTGANSAELDLSTFPDSQICHSSDGDPQIDWVSYCPTTSFEVPANSLITVVIKQYDSASGLYNGFFQHVQGTVGNTATYNGKSMSQINGDDAAHTFTIQSRPDEANPIFVSVPLLGVADDAPNNTMVNGIAYPTPNVIEFQFRTGPAGTYVWHCYVPCGNDRESPWGFTGPMSTTGFMAGTMTVASY